MFMGVHVQAPRKPTRDYPTRIKVHMGKGLDKSLYSESTPPTHSRPTEFVKLRMRPSSSPKSKLYALLGAAWLPCITAAFEPNNVLYRWYDGATPVFQYTPSDAWTYMWTGSNPKQWTPDAVAVGLSNTTAVYRNDAEYSVSLDYYGIEATAFVSIAAGNSTPQHNTTITLEIDGRVVNTQHVLPSSSQVALPTLVTVENGPHTATVSFSSNSPDYDFQTNPYTLVFYAMAINNSVQAQGNDSEWNLPLHAARLARNGAKNMAFTWTGNWNFQNVISYQNQDGVSRQSMVGSPGASCSTLLPANSSWVEVNATKGHQAGSVSLDLAPPGPLRGARTANTSSTFIQEQVIYFASLDPAIQYNLSMTVGNNHSVILSSVAVKSFYLPGSEPGWGADFGIPTDSSASTPPAGSNSKALPAGVAVGAGLGLIGITVVIYLVIMKSSVQAKRNMEESRTVEAGSATSTVTQPLLSPSIVTPFVRSSSSVMAEVGSSRRPSKAYDFVRGVTNTSSFPSQADSRPSTQLRLVSGEDAAEPAGGEEQRIPFLDDGLHEEDAGPATFKLPPRYNADWGQRPEELESPRSRGEADNSGGSESPRSPLEADNSRASEDS